MGFDLISSDGSHKMLKAIAKNASQLGVDLDIVKKPVLWSELDYFFSKNEFDVIVCTGNALCHVPPEGAYVAIQQMKLILKKDGLCIIDVKRYDERVRELHYDLEKGWVPRNVRIDRGHFSDNKNADFMTTLTYEGEDVPGRAYEIVLEVRYDDGELRNCVFPVWAITESMIRKYMQILEMEVKPVYKISDPVEWKYRLCIGKKRSI